MSKPSANIYVIKLSSFLSSRNKSFLLFLQKNLTKYRIGRSRRRIVFIFIFLLIIFVIPFIYKPSKIETVLLSLTVPALLGYIFYLDQKHLDKIYEYKFKTYIDTLESMSHYYKIPTLFLTDNMVNLEELKHASPQNNISSAMLLLSNNASYMAMSKLSSMILEKTLKLTLLLEKNISIKNTKQESFRKFYGLLDKSKLSCKSKINMDPEADIVTPVSNKISIMTEALVVIKEINALTIELANEMRKDLELEGISEDQKKIMAKSLDDSVNGLFNFLRSLINQISERFT